MADTDGPQNARAVRSMSAGDGRGHMIALSGFIAAQGKDAQTSTVSVRESPIPPRRSQISP